MSNQNIYLDNAATSWPKPNSVYDAVDQYQRHVGVPYGRGGSAEAAAVGRSIEQLRVGLAEFINAGEPAQIVFTYSGTDSLNIAIHGAVRSGDHVVTTCAEHNSVLRPLRHLEQRSRGEISVTRVRLDGDGVVAADAVIEAVEPNTRLVCVTHVSNVTGAILPVAEIGERLNTMGEDRPLFLVDAAQSLGHLSLDVRSIDCDLLAAPGHKGLLGPTGTGVLFVSKHAEKSLSPYRQGGTGTQSELDAQPTEMPTRFESGNHNVPGLLGMAAGLAYVRGRGVDAIRHHEMELVTRLQDRLSSMPHITTYGPKCADDRVGVLSLNVAGMDPQDVAAILDSSLRVQCRSGLHCSPLIHDALGTRALGGTLRISPGPFTTNADVDSVADLLDQLG